MTAQPSAPRLPVVPGRTKHKPVTLGQVLRAVRQAVLWLLVQFGAALGAVREGGKPVSPQFLNDVEHQRRQPSEELLEHIAAVLHLNGTVLHAVAGMPLPTVRAYLQQWPDTAPAVLRVFRLALARGFTDWQRVAQLIEQTTPGTE